MDNCSEKKKVVFLIQYTKAPVTKTQAQEPGSEVIMFFFMLNSAEHENLNALMCENIKKFGFFRHR